MIYTVKSGDSLSIIAAKYGQPYSSWKILYQKNPEIGNNPDKIFPGQQIIIPDEWAATSSTEEKLPVTEKTDNSWIYWAGGLALLWMAYKKRGKK